MILSAQTIRSLCSVGDHEKGQALDIIPFSEKAEAFGMSYGLSHAGYDIRIGKIDRPGRIFVGDKPGGNKTWVAGAAQSWLAVPGSFVLLSSLERLRIPNNVLATVHDKSTLARQGIALQNTVLEPGWEGYITLELSNHGPSAVRIRVGQPIAQVVFQFLDFPTDNPYQGKYQDQPAEPVHAKLLSPDG